MLRRFVQPLDTKKKKKLFLKGFEFIKRRDSSFIHDAEWPALSIGLCSCAIYLFRYWHLPMQSYSMNVLDLLFLFFYMYPTSSFRSWFVSVHLSFCDIILILYNLILNVWNHQHDSIYNITLQSKEIALKKKNLRFGHGIKSTSLQNASRTKWLVHSRNR